MLKWGDPSLPPNRKPIVLANTIYKLFTNTLTSILSSYGEKYQILQDSPKGLRTKWYTLRQIQTLVAVLEDAQFTKQDIYLLYIDFKYAFGSIDHARLLVIMEDLGYPKYVVKFVGNIYSHSNTIFIGEDFNQTK